MSVLSDAISEFDRKMRQFLLKNILSVPGRQDLDDLIDSGKTVQLEMDRRDARLQLSWADGEDRSGFKKRLGVTSIEYEKQ